MSDQGELTAKQQDASRLVALFDAPVMTAQGPVEAGLLWERYQMSPYARYMDTDQPYRFSQDFGYDQERMLLDMGLDVVPTEHQRQTGMFAAWLLDRDFAVKGRYPVEQQDIGVLMLATLTHDSGESMHPELLEDVGAVVGDIAFGRKTDEDRAIEASVRAAIYARVLHDVRPDALELMESIIMHQDTTARHEVYEAAHDLQAFNTALLAGHSFARHIRGLSTVPQVETRSYTEIMQMIKLASAVLDTMIPRVKHWAGKFVFAAEMAEENQELLALHDAAQ